MQGLIPTFPILQRWIQPLAVALDLQALPFHIHEIVVAFTLYHIIFKYLSPLLSAWWFPLQYRKLDRFATLDWNLQCVSMVQSILICSLGLWVIIKDVDRQKADPKMRVWGYSGSAGSVQAFATGYFLWDLVVTLQHLDYLGLPVLIHAFSCLAVYLIGFVSLNIFV
jgi:TLC domain